MSFCRRRASLADKRLLNVVVGEKLSSLLASRWVSADEMLIKLRLELSDQP